MIIKNISAFFQYKVENILFAWNHKNSFFTYNTLFFIFSLFFFFFQCVDRFLIEYSSLNDVNFISIIDGISKSFIEKTQFPYIDTDLFISARGVFIH